MTKWLKELTPSQRATVIGGVVFITFTLLRIWCGEEPLLVSTLGLLVVLGTAVGRKYAYGRWW